MAQDGGTTSRATPQGTPESGNGACCARQGREIVTEENTTIMLGVMRSQGQDIRRIFERLETIDSRLETIDEHVNAIERRLDRLETKFTEHTTLLTQILARLPKTP